MAAADIDFFDGQPSRQARCPWQTSTKNLDRVKDRFPGVKVYQDWRELLDKEKSLNSVNVSTPDHMHASITMRALKQGLHVYCQKPMTQTIYEARQVARVAREKSLVTQMGIQIHSHEIHRTIVATIQAGTIGKVKEVHSWSGKHWGDNRPKPDRTDPIPAGLKWDFWLGVAAERPYLARYYHPGEWRKARIDFGNWHFTEIWAATFWTRYSRPWRSLPRGRFILMAARPTAATGASIRKCATSFRKPCTRPTQCRSPGMTAANDPRTT